VPEDQLSLAIGRDGQNARLAAKLTGWRIDIKSLPEAAADSLFKLQNEPDYVENPDVLAEVSVQVEAVLEKKEEGRAVTPEEYTLLGNFVNRVELGAEDRRLAEAEAQKAVELEARASIPDSAFDIPLDDLGISPRVTILLTGEGYSTIGDLMMQLALDADVVLALNGIGPKMMEDIQAAIAAYDFPVVEEPEPVVEEIEAAEEVEAGAEVEVEEAVEAEAVVEEVETEAIAEAKAEAESEEVVEAEIVEAEAEEEPEDFEEAFAKFEEIFEIVDEDGDEDYDELDDGKKVKKKKQYRHVEYDPDLGVEIVRRRRKRDTDDWEEDWEEF
jgi:N utilization substance protein A